MDMGPGISWKCIPEPMYFREGRVLCYTPKRGGGSKLVRREISILGKRRRELVRLLSIHIVHHPQVSSFTLRKACFFFIPRRRRWRNPLRSIGKKRPTLDVSDNGR